jgi:zinc transporter ZupT
MMIAASASLVYEGVMFNEVAGFFGYHSLFRVVAGFVLGSVFILWTKKVLDQHEDIKFGSIEGAGAQKMLLIVFVMTLHSLTEGIGIGVSFGGQTGSQLGQLISLSLALHNVPEGLAVALVLTSRGMPKIKTALWCVFTSLPQPLMAIPAYLFVERFLAILPAGLGFASGAMLYVAIFELFMEAAEDTSITVSAVTSVASFLVMIAAQELVKVVL